ncbi:MAG: biopolymer transporter ExbD [Bacteroidia bacterium]
MTPMVDLAFLLSYILYVNCKFRPDEPVIVDQPSSVSDIPLPDKGVIMLTVDGKGRVFFNVEGQQLRETSSTKSASNSSKHLTRKEQRFAVLAPVTECR